MEQGTLKTYEDNVLQADDQPLQCNNYTQIPSMDVLKTAVREQANKMHLDQDLFTELRLLLFSMMESDTTSKEKNKGNLNIFLYVAFVDYFDVIYQNILMYYKVMCIHFSYGHFQASFILKGNYYDL